MSIPNDAKHSGTSGTCNWYVTMDGLLVIEPQNGTGVLRPHVFQHEYPWSDDNVSKDIIHATVRQGVSVSEEDGASWMFSNCYNLVSADVTNLGAILYDSDHMFKNCTSLKSIVGLDGKTIDNADRMFWCCDVINKIDLSGTIISGSMEQMFASCGNLQEIVLSTKINATTTENCFEFCKKLEVIHNIESLRCNEANANLTLMFYHCDSLMEVNLSSIETSNETPGSMMFGFCDSLTKITLGEKWKGVKGESDICQNGPCRNTKNGISITNDEDFEKLESDKYAGTWIRQASGGSLTCIAQRSVNGEPEDSGQDVILTVKYVSGTTTEAGTLKIYKKKSDVADYPSSASYSKTLTKLSGIETITFTIGEDAWDFKVEYYDGNATWTSYPSIESNVRLFEIDTDGNVKITGGLISCGTNHTLTPAEMTVFGQRVDVFNTGAISLHDLLDGITEKLSKALTLNSVYPIGSIYMSVNSADPGSLIGGTWERIKDRFLLSAGDTYAAGNTGGSADSVVVSHTHEQKAHSHGFSNGDKVWTTASGATEPGNQISGTAKYYAATSKKDYTWISKTDSATPGINSTGESGVGKNMPPYLAVYVWKRIS